MENPNRNIEEKLQTANSAYLEIFEQLTIGGVKIKKDLRNSREARFCHKVETARKQLKSALESVHNAPELRHIQLLAEAIYDVIDLLKLTKEDYHAKGLQQTREYAEDLLKKTETQLKTQMEECLWENKKR